MLLVFPPTPLDLELSFHVTRKKALPKIHWNFHKKPFLVVGGPGRHHVLNGLNNHTSLNILIHFAPMLPGPLLDSKGMCAIFQKQQKKKKEQKRAEYLKIWVKSYKIWKYFEKGHLHVNNHCMHVPDKCALVTFLHPMKNSENQRFSNVFRGIEMEHWAKLGKSLNLN